MGDNASASAKTFRERRQEVRMNRLVALGEMMAKDAGAVCERVTGKTPEEWEEVYRRRRKAAIGTGKLTQWIPPLQLDRFASFYGFMEDDDFINGWVPVQLARLYGWTPLSKNGAYPTGNVLMWKLNPEKYPI